MVGENYAYRSGKRYCRACKRIRERNSKRRPRTIEELYHQPAYSYCCFVSNCKRRGITVLITREQYTEIRSRPCHYCGRVNGGKVGGIDRIDPNGVYEYTNCHPSCSRCNYGKHTDTDPEFREWILSVHHHWASRESH